MAVFFSKYTLQECWSPIGRYIYEYVHLCHVLYVIYFIGAAFCPWQIEGSKSSHNCAVHLLAEQIFSFTGCTGQRLLGMVLILSANSGLSGFFECCPSQVEELWSCTMNNAWEFSWFNRTTCSRYSIYDLHNFFVHLCWYLSITVYLSNYRVYWTMAYINHELFFKLQHWSFSFAWISKFYVWNVIFSQ